MSAIAGGAIMLILFGLSIVVFMVACMWRLYEKAGQEGWASIIPIYSTIIQLRIIEKPWWWLLLMLIPYIGLIWNIWALNLFVKKFGKSEGWTVGCIFLPFIFFPIMAFSNDIQFVGYSDSDDWNTQNNDVLDQI